MYKVVGCVVSVTSYKRGNKESNSLLLFYPFESKTIILFKIIVKLPKLKIINKKTHACLFIERNGLHRITVKRIQKVMQF